MHIGLYRTNTWFRANYEQVVAQHPPQALIDGRASVRRISAVGAIVIEDGEYDFGWIAIYDLGDGTSCWICEEDFRDAGGFYDAAKESLIDRLPQNFEIVRTAAEGIWLGLTNCEGKLEPELRIRDRDLPARFFDRGDWPQSKPSCPAARAKCCAVGV